MEELFFSANQPNTVHPRKFEQRCSDTIKSVPISEFVRISEVTLILSRIYNTNICVNPVWPV